MPLAIETVAGVAASGTAVAVIPFTPANGDSFTVRNFPSSAKANLDMLLGEYASKQAIRLRSPMLHDDVQGIRYAIDADSQVDLLARSGVQNLVAQDNLTLELAVTTAPGVTEDEVAAYTVYYSDLPGASARLRMPGDIAGSIVNITTLEVPVTSSATVGNWAGATWDSFEDLLKANTDYAVLGYTLDTAVAAVAVRGADTSNFRVGGPGAANPFHTRNYFADLSLERGTPHIPVINSANKSGTFVDVVHRTASVATNVCLTVAQLSSTS